MKENTMSVDERVRDQSRCRYPSINALSTTLSSYAKLDEERNEPKILQKKKAFPKELRIFLQYIHGNGVCPDCELRRGCGGPAPQEFMTGLPIKKESNLTWAK